MEPCLTYFKGWGLSEQIRWMLSAVFGAGWKNVGLENREQMETLLNGDKLMFNQLPLLEINGKLLVQSQPMVRYVAKVGSLNGKDVDEETLIDMILSNIRDVRSPVVSYPFSEDKESVKVKALQLVEKFFPRLEKILKANQSDHWGFVSSLSAADILVGELIHELCSEGGLHLVAAEKVQGEFPALWRVYEGVVSLDNIKAYLGSNKRYPAPVAGKIGDEYVANVNLVLGR
mmetsp:Transcript_8954/g.14570  ORF Transcript_8954/g.14570 Transcript_8954/m.14570 type:complete len:231 (+) Transcript_8954:221-913(+)|eukprot:CAMPEP_0203752296 /NCGR_PEP_ID=MMETSP0098-20131031/6234_1 /ASSEMBLY_ACC=CAM_ASM_000208 /TAXON_ID=96639 /ORGANISM=" , Strain NY0313808BC1" /LENGTH=230 /DNA_ID=CAMNT_0050642389 /DNA_START=484 /DNA_END=1176 /DNA_ORIENTATION=+